MAKNTNNNKTTFGKRKGGKARKNRGPKDKQIKDYVQQGR